MSIKTKYIKNSFFNFIGWGWLIAINILTIPYIVNKIGYDQYGIFVLVSMVLGYFAFLDFGLGDAVVKYVSHYYASRDYKKINCIVNAILFLFVLIGVAGGTSILFFTKYLAFRIFKIPVPLHDIAQQCFYLSALGFFLNLIFGVVSKIPEALQHFDLSNKINMIIGTIVTLANLLFVYLGFSIRELVYVNLIGSVLGITSFGIMNKRIIPELSINFSFSYKELKEILHFGLFTICTKFSSIMTSWMNQLVLSNLVGVSAVTLFNVPFKVITRIQALLYSFAGIIFPLSSELAANGDTEKLYRVYLRLARYIFMMSSILFLPLIVFSDKVLLYWMGKTFASQTTYCMIMICLTFYLIGQATVPGLLSLGLGKPKYNAYFSFLTAILNILLVYPLTKKWGVNGAATALFLSSLQVPFAVYFTNKYVIKIGNALYLQYVFMKFILPGVLTLLVLVLLNKMMSSLLSFCVIATVSYLFVFFLFLSTGLENEDKNMIIGKLKIMKFSQPS
ncbi:MAG: oligosaccharide flippase family protein [Candidatus Omnitrophica bacterium]|nr:oligosaccharide flippase family protein [Candidatus Omnitrophota bacterium]